MAELIFGSAPQVWPSTAAPMFGYLQPQIPAGARPLGPVSPTVGAQGFASGVFTSAPPLPQRPDGYAPALGGPIAGGGMSAMIATPLASLPAAGFENITAPALLAAVAMRRGQPLGPANDQEIEDFIGDALDLLPGAVDIEVRCEAGRVMLSGAVPHKRLKHDAGEIAWAIPSVNDVQNHVTITARRRSRAGRESEGPVPAGRKQP